MDQAPFEHLIDGGESRIYSSFRHGQRLHAFGLQDALRLYAKAKHELISPPAAPSPVKKKAGGSRAATGLPKPRRRRDPLPGHIWVSVVLKSGGGCEGEGGDSTAPSSSTLSVSGNKEFEPIQVKAGPETTAGELKKKILPRVALAVKSPQCQLEHMRLACPSGMFVEEQTLGDWDVRQDEFIFCFVAAPGAEAQ